MTKIFAAASIFISLLFIAACGADWQAAPCATCCTSCTPTVVVVTPPDSGTPVVDAGQPDAGPPACVPSCNSRSCGMGDGCGHTCYPVCENGRLKDHESSLVMYTPGGNECKYPVCRNECQQLCYTNYTHSCQERTDCLKCCEDHVP